MTYIGETDLHEIDQKRLYCGPAAVQAVTGLDYTTQIRPLMNRIRYKRYNQGVCGYSFKNMNRVLKKLGFLTEMQTPKDKITLEKFLDAYPDLLMIIGVTGHFIAYHNGIIVDNHTRFGCPANEHWARRKQVKEYWFLDKNDLDTSIFPDEESIISEIQEEHECLLEMRMEDDEDQDILEVSQDIYNEWKCDLDEYLAGYEIFCNQLVYDLADRYALHILKDFLKGRV